MRFRKKPVVIEAVQVTAADYNGALDWDKAWDGSPFKPDIPPWLEDAIRAGTVRPENHDATDYAVWDIDTMDNDGGRTGTVTARPGDWIIRGVRGELYPCEAGVFDATYEPADDPAPREGE